MKYLILCEGPNEKKLIEILLEHNKLIVSPDDLVGRVPYHARQIHKSAMVMGQLRMYHGEMQLWRIGDKQSDRFDIPREFRTQIKEFAKQYISYNHSRYKGDTKFYETYYGEDVSKLVNAIREYKRKNHAHKPEEHYLAELLV